MCIPKIGLTHIFFEAFQNFQGERLSKSVVFVKKERHNFRPCGKPALKFHQIAFSPDLLATEFSKTLFFCQALINTYIRMPYEFFKVRSLNAVDYPDLLIAFGVDAYECRLGQYMSAHGRLELRFIGMLQVRKYCIQRIEPKKIPVPADGRTGTAVARAMPVIDAFPGTRRKFLQACGEIRYTGRDVVQDPMHPDALGGSRVWSVGVFDNES